MMSSLLSTTTISSAQQQQLRLILVASVLLHYYLSTYADAFFIITTQQRPAALRFSSKQRCNNDDDDDDDARLAFPRVITAATTTTRLHANAKSNLNADGKCKFGTKEYWDAMYSTTDNATDNGDDDDNHLPSDKYSWYCGWTELKPFWDMLITPLLSTSTDDEDTDEDDAVKKKKRNKHEIKVLIAGIGNDITPIQMYDDGWTNMIAFDYSESGVGRAKELFGPTRLLIQEQTAANDDDDTSSDVTSTADTTTINNDANGRGGEGGTAKLIIADCRSLPIPNGHIHAILDKGTLDAIYITGPDVFHDSVKELTRVTARKNGGGGMIICVSNVIPQEVMLDAFGNSQQSGDGEEEECYDWEVIHDGGLAFANGGEATIDLGANLYSFRRL